MIKLYTDGGARGNPGPAGIGAVIIDEKGEVLGEISEYIGKATNNIAEYTALVRGLEKVLELGFKEVSCFLDSELAVKQLNREYKVKNEEIWKLFIKVYNLTHKFKKISFKHVERAKNKHADKLVNKALEALKPGFSPHWS